MSNAKYSEWIFICNRGVPFAVFAFVHPIFYAKGSECVKVQSIITGKCYETDNCVYIVNPLQVYKYLVNNALPLDIVPGEDNKIVYVFDRKNTYQLYDLWCKREL